MKRPGAHHNRLLAGSPASSEPGAPSKSGRSAVTLRLPEGISACLFDLDGVLTQTATVHATAWKQMFDAFLRERASQTGEPFAPFEIASDYPTYVDGKLRLDGVRSFLESRGVEIPEGSAGDPPEAQTVHGLGRRKNDAFQIVLHERGVDVYESSVRFVEAVRDAGIHRAVVSSSKNCQDILITAGIEDLFEVRVDGLVAEREGLPGKPAPDTFLSAAARLGIDPAAGAVFEDAVAGVQAGRAGSFGCVVGVDRVGHADELRINGADIVVADLSELMEEH